MLETDRLVIRAFVANDASHPVTRANPSRNSSIKREVWALSAGKVQFRRRFEAGAAREDELSAA